MFINVYIYIWIAFIQSPAYDPPRSRFNSEAQEVSVKAGIGEWEPPDVLFFWVMPRGKNAWQNDLAFLGEDFCYGIDLTRIDGEIRL